MIVSYISIASIFLNERHGDVEAAIHVEFFIYQDYDETISRSMINARDQ